MTEELVLALDQGTTSSRAVLVDRAGRPVALEQREFRQLYPRPGWVEHEPAAILESQLAAAKSAIEAAGASPGSIVGLGVTNQRETTIVWDRETGQPVYNAIVWQDRRTAEYCDHLRREGWESEVRARTGLVIDPYFSATKLRWILDIVDGARARAEAGRLLFGTVDTFLFWHLSGGAVHTTDHSNASRTMLFNIHTGQWDEDLLAELDIPRSLLPSVRDSSAVYGHTAPEILGARIPLAGDAGDQQAATFGQACFEPGAVKCTYGTGNFILMNTGTTPRRSDARLLTTIAWVLDGAVTYAVEGSVFVTGAAIQWLRDELRLIADAPQSEALARSVPDAGGVYLVPAFVGLGAPYWDPYARGAIAGLTRGSSQAHIVRAALESVAFQTQDVLDAMQRDAGLTIRDLRVDGGMTGNDFLLQFQADISDLRITRPVVTQTTALGASYLAGLATGFWSGLPEIAALWRADAVFEPAMPGDRRRRLRRDWQRAVERARAWIEPEEESRGLDAGAPSIS